MRRKRGDKMAQEPQRPYYDRKLAAEQHAMRLAKEALRVLPKGALAFGKAIVKRPSDEVMSQIRKA